MEDFQGEIAFIRDRDSESKSQEKIERLEKILLTWNELTREEQSDFESLLQELQWDLDWEIRMFSAFMMDFLAIVPDNKPLYLVAKLQFNELLRYGPEVVELTYELMGSFPEAWVSARLVTIYYRILENSTEVLDRILAQEGIHPEAVTGLSIVLGKITGEFQNPTHKLLAEHMIMTVNNLEMYNLGVMTQINASFDRIFKLGSEFIDKVGQDLSNEDKSEFK